MGKVSIIRASERPDDERVYQMVKEAIDLLGGLETIVRPGQTVALKPNVVTGKLSGPGVTTDKRVVEALIRLCNEAGAGKVKVVEGAGYFTETSEALELSGIKALAEEYGAEVVDVDRDEHV